MTQTTFDFETLERETEFVTRLVVQYLHEHAIGPQHAKTRRQIEKALYARLGLNPERLLRSIANKANAAGVPIATSNDGYFWASHFDDFEPMLARLRHQRDQMHERVLAIERLRKKLFQQE